jgi:hypothetical protein
MRVAICLSGQPRTWKECLPNWLDSMELVDRPDFFFHFWDYNTLPSLLASYKKSIVDEKLQDVEKQDIIDALAPKKFKFESRKDIPYWNCDIPENMQFGPWCREQFYSAYYVSLLKREYELMNKFRYDVVIRLRSDLWFTEKLQIETPEPNSLYTTHCSYDNEYDVYRIGDIFYYADSSTFDQVSQFFKFLSYVPTNWVTPKNCPPPEIAMSYFLTNIGIINRPTRCLTKIKRPSIVKEIKGSLDSYEI